MSSAISPKVPTDGMFLYLDASNKRSHPGSGTNWFNLLPTPESGSYFTSPTFDSGNGGAVAFDGDNDQINLPILATGNDFSVTTWVYAIEQSNINMIMANNVGGAISGFLLYWNTYLTSDRKITIETADGTNQSAVEMIRHWLNLIHGSILGLY